MLRTAASSLARAALPEPSLLPAVAHARQASRLARRRRSHPAPPPPSSPPPSTASPPAARPDEPAPSHAPAIQEPPPPPAQATVEVPHDADGVIDRSSGTWVEPLKALLSQPSIVVARQLEPLNIFLGFEQANKYQLHAPDGAVLGYLLEEETSVVGTMSRQLLRTHRPFRAIVMSPAGDVLLRIRRPFSWINSRIYVSTPTSASITSASDAKDELQRLDAPGAPPASTALAATARAPETDDQGEVIGETQQEWALMRRRYNLFLRRGSNDGDGDGGEFDQFGRIDSGFLAWDFTVRDEANAPIGKIDRNFAGFGRELFTDTGQYVLHFEGVVDELAARLEGPDKPAGLLSSGASVPATEAGGAQGTAVEPAAAASSSSASNSAVSQDLALAERAPALPLDHRAVLLASAVSASLSSLCLSTSRIVLAVDVSMIHEADTLPLSPSPLLPSPLSPSPLLPLSSPRPLAHPLPLAHPPRSPIIAAIDFDYFTRQRGGLLGGGGGMFMPMPIGGFGGGAAEGAEGGEGAEAGRVQGEGEDGPLPSSERDPSEPEYGSGSLRPGSDSEFAPEDDVMRDPWAQDPPAEEEGGTWGWSDLFDNDGDGGGGGGDGGGDW